MVYEYSDPNQAGFLMIILSFQGHIRPIRIFMDIQSRANRQLIAKCIKIYEGLLCGEPLPLAQSDHQSITALNIGWASIPKAVPSAAHNGAGRIFTEKDLSIATKAVSLVALLSNGRLSAAIDYLEPVLQRHRNPYALRMLLVDAESGYSGFNSDLLSNGDLVKLRELAVELRAIKSKSPALRGWIPSVLGIRTTAA